MKGHKAFGLRDMIALLCLAAVALPVLAASLQGAINLSAAERCRANLASLTRCVMVYTLQNRGGLPVYVQRYREAGGYRYIEGPSQPDRTAVAFAYGPLNPTTGLLADARGLGRLYVQGLARPPELLYCPARIGDTRHMLSNYPKPWGSKLGLSASMYIRIGYMFDPFVKQIPGGSSYQVTYDDALILQRHPADWPLICDLVLSMQVTGHVEGGSAFWNLAYPDGHVAPKSDQELFDQFAAGLDARLEWQVWNQFVRPKLLPPGNP